jgi:hypothetical protein
MIGHIAPETQEAEAEEEEIGVVAITATDARYCTFIHAMLMIVCGSIGSICTRGSSERVPTGCQVANSIASEKAPSFREPHRSPQVLRPCDCNETDEPLFAESSSLLATYSYKCGSLAEFFYKMLTTLNICA